MPRPRCAPPTRRALLGTLAVAALAVSGCGVRWVGGPEPTPAPDRGPDDDAREAAVAGTRALLTLLGPAAAGPEPLRTVAGQAVQACRAHLVALGEDDRIPTATGSPTPTDAPSGAPAPDARALVDGLLAAAGTACAAATSTAPAVSGGMARLLTAIAASRAVLADAVAATTGTPAGAIPPTAEPGPTAAPASSPASTSARTPSPDGDDPATAALQAALAGEHAAVHGFALVAGRLTAPRRAEAVADLAARRVARDDLVDLLTARGATPVQAAPGYDAAAPTPEAATALAASVLDRLARLYADVVAVSAPDRALGARAVPACARDARRWGSTARSFPGLPELGADGPPTSTASPTASSTASASATATP
ncbi:DUF4439 domain-containing protein [Kineococcus aurantiacus]|uniref:DUF4439 domain-containing protein n=1 Tax=Kineococcus aurantiacus TaxID=37633 RepID=A0A7Y9DPE4_9ACTN|nr:hypothetical protein [Kineococcus aurantiacus]